jgi:hypothetical protein
MRTSAAALLALAGCNQVFGLNATRAWDASPDGGGLDGPLARLTIAQRVLLKQGTAAMLADGAIASLDLRVGPADGDLFPVVVDDMGGFGIPEALTTQRYRLVYATPGDPVSHEVQWQGGDGARIAIPQWGRVPRSAPPANMDFVFHVTNPPASFHAGNGATVLTVGQWSRGTVAAASDTVVYPYWSNARSLGGPLGTPDSAHADQEVLIELEPIDVGSPDVAVTGFATMTADLSGSTSGTNVAWMSSGQVSMTYNVQGNPSTRVPTVITGAVPTLSSDFQAGDLPNPDMPVMTEPSADSTGGMSSTGAFLALAQYADGTRPLAFVDPFAGQGFTSALLARAKASRTVNGLVLDSGFQQIGTLSGGAVNQITFDVGIADNVTLAGHDLVGVASEAVPITLPAHASSDLSFSIAGGARTSDCTVTLYAVDDGPPPALVPVRTFLVLPASPTIVNVPPDIFLSGKTYAFAIRCTDQHAIDSTMLDFRQLVGFPRSESTLFPATFTVTLQ